MYTLRRLNVEKIVSTEAKRDELLSKGFVLVESAAEKKVQVKDKPLEKRTLDELKEVAAANKIDITGLDTKAEILAKIKEAEQGN
jgi:hypothetical protein